MQVRVGVRPIWRLARVGEQMGFPSTWNHVPASAIASRCGIFYSSKSKPYKAEVRRGEYLGYFATPEEAALHVARANAGAAGLLAPPSAAFTPLRAAPPATPRAKRKASPPPSSDEDEDEETTEEEETALEHTVVMQHGQRTGARCSSGTVAPPMTAEEALRQAEAEGLTLLKSEDNATGFMNVRRRGGQFQACPRCSGRRVNLGSFTMAEEAALVVARTPEAQAAVAEAAAPPAPPPLTAEEALRQAEAEGLTLLRSSENTTGFMNVNNNTIGAKRSKPFSAQARSRGAMVRLGYFATAEEAALTVARRSVWKRWRRLDSRLRRASASSGGGSRSSRATPRPRPR